MILSRLHMTWESPVVVKFVFSDFHIFDLRNATSFFEEFSGTLARGLADRTRRDLRVFRSARLAPRLASPRPEGP